MKACIACGEVKPLAEFGKEKRNRDGLAGRCYACERARSAERRKTPEYRERTTQWQKNARSTRPELREQARRYSAEYRATNPDKVKEALRKWTLNNISAVRAYNATQRANRRQAVPDWMTSEHLDKIASVYTAAQELSVSTGVKHVVDHIVPLKNNNICGLHVWWNLRVITETENARKKNRFDLALYPEQGELTKIKEIDHAGC